MTRLRKLYGLFLPLVFLVSCSITVSPICPSIDNNQGLPSIKGKLRATSDKETPDTIASLVDDKRTVEFNYRENVISKKNNELPQGVQLVELVTGIALIHLLGIPTGTKVVEVQAVLEVYKDDHLVKKYIADSQAEKFVGWYYGYNFKDIEAAARKRGRELIDNYIMQDRAFLESL